MPAVLDRPSVTPAIEPMTRTDEELILFVTQEDIDNGIQGNSGWCAIVRAANRLGRGGSWSMSTSGTLEFVPLGPGPREYWLSWDAGNFAFAFDKNADSVQPTRFVFRRDSAAGRSGQ